MPNSVLWVCLVAVWLFVLVPMILKGRPQMRKTTDAVKATRLLHRGGTKARTTRRRASGTHPHDPSWKSDRSERSARRTRSATAVLDDHAADDQVVDDQTVDEKDEPATDSATKASSPAKMRRATGASVPEPTVDTDADTDLVDDEVADADGDDVAADIDLDGAVSAVPEMGAEDEDADDEDTITVDGEFVDSEPGESAEDSDVKDSAADDDVVDAELATDADLEGDGEFVDEDDHDGVGLADDEVADDLENDYEDDEYDDDLEDEYEDDAYDDDLEHEYEDDEYDDFEDDDFEDEPAVARRPDDRGADDAPAEPVSAVADHRPESRRRRTAYSPDAKRAEMRYRERQRVLLGLVILLIAAAASGVFLGLVGWMLTAVCVLMVIGYLAFLRRAVATEQHIRAQRSARARRARLDEEERGRRAAAVPEFAAAPPPPRLRRPGGATVLEIDDEDPVFDHLRTYQHRRVMSEDREQRRAG